MGSKIAGIVVLAVLLAGLGDMLKNKAGVAQLGTSTNQLLGTTLKGASGGYA